MKPNSANKFTIRFHEIECDLEGALMECIHEIFVSAIEGDHEIVDAYEDGNPEHPSSVVLTFAQNGKFYTIEFASLSHFSRDTLDSLRLKRMLVNAASYDFLSVTRGGFGQ